MGQRTSTLFNAAGQVQATVDPLGQRTTQITDAANRVVATIDPLGQRSSIVYDAAGRSLASIDPLGQRTSTVYDNAGRAVASIDPLGHRTSTVFNAAGQTVATIDPLNQRTSTVFDGAGRAVASINPLGQRTSTVFDAAGQAVASIDPLGNRTSTAFDAAGERSASINALGQRTTSNYDSAGRVVASIDPLGNRTSTVFDNAGRTLATIDPLNQRSSTVFDAAGQAIASLNALGQRTSTTYDAAGRAIASIDPLGNRTSTVFDNAGRAIAQSDPLHQRTSTVYDAAGRSIASIDPLGNRNSTTYDAAGRSLARIDPLNRRSSTLYDAAGRSIATVNPLQQRNSTLYDKASRAIASINPLNQRSSTLYDPAGRSIASINPLGNRMSTTYDAAGRGIASSNALAQRTSTLYDAAGRTIASINPLNQRTSTTYDAAGRSIASINPLQQRTSTSYDAAGRAIATIDPRGYRSSTTYRPTGDVLASIDPLGGRITSLYDAASRPIASVNPLGFRTSTTYRATGDQLASIDPLGFRTTNLYDAASRPIATVNGLGYRTTSVLDGAGQQRASIDPLGRRTTQNYDLAGRQVSSTDANGNRTSTTFDAAGRAMAQTNALGYRVSSLYDAAGRRIGLTDPNGNATTFLFDAAGQDLGSIDPLLRRVSFGYDGAGNKLFKLDPRGIRVTFGYDPAQRLTQESYSTGKRVSYVYDANGNQTVLLDATGRTSSAYDALNRVVQVVNPDAKRASYSFDAAGRRTRLIDPDGGRFSYSFDGKDQLTLLLNPQGKRSSWTYDGLGRQTAQRHANGSRTSWVFDAAGQQSVVANSKSDGTVVNRLSYSYDNAGNRTVVRESSGDRTSWTYDNAYQLLRELRTGNTAFAVTYAYDPAGNRTQQTDAGVRTTYVRDAANQLSTATAAGARTSWTYDNCGNRILQNAPSGMTFYGWDENSRLAVATPVGGAVSLTYNGKGQRVQKLTGSQTRNFFYDFEKVLQEYDATLTTDKEYTSTTALYGDLISAYAGGSSSYYEPDALGSTDALVNDSQTATDRYAYRAFGLSLQTQGSSSNDFTWVGRQGYFSDPETSLYFLRARYFDFATGTFISEDPSGFKGGDFNLYRYAGNNPVNHTDPSGLAIWVDVNDLYPATLRVPLIPCTDDWKQAYEMKQWDALNQGFALITPLASAPGDALRDKIFQTLVPWPDNVWTSQNQYYLLYNNTRNENNHIYAKLNLFDRLPADFWDLLQNKPTKDAQDLAQLITTGLEHDRVLRLQGNDLQLTMFPKPPPTFFGSLFDLVSQVTQFFVNVGSLVLSGIGKLLEVGFVALLKLFGIDADQIKAALAKLGDVLVLIKDIALSPVKFATNLVTGGLDGFTQFAQAFPQNVLDAALNWLFGKLNMLLANLPPLPQTFDVASITLFLLEVAGLTWTNLKQRLTQALPPGAVTQALGIAQTLLGDPPSISNVKDRLNQYNQSLTDATELLSWDSIWTWLTGNLPQTLFDWGLGALGNLAKKVIPGGGSLLAIWDTVSFVVAEKQRVMALLAAIGGALQAAVSGSSSVASSVAAGLQRLLEFVLGLIASLLGLNDLAMKIQDLVAKFVCWIRDKVDSFLDWLLGQCGACRRAKAKAMGTACGTCFVSQVRVWTWQGLMWISRVQLGWPVPTYTETEREGQETASGLEEDPERLRVVLFSLERADGSGVAIQLLRAVEWLEKEGAAPGALVWLAMPEMGAVGWARVTGVLPCPPLPVGQGRRVTGLFRHRSGVVFDLRLEGEPKPIGVTPSHPFWSQDRQDWVPAGQLCVGERLRAGDGSTPMVLGLQKREKAEEVYNLEVEGDHVYRVGEQGLLVHNMSAPVAVTVPGGGGGPSGGGAPCTSSTSDACDGTAASATPPNQTPRVIYNSPTGRQITVWGVAQVTRFPIHRLGVIAVCEQMLRSMGYDDIHLNRPYYAMPGYGPQGRLTSRRADLVGYRHASPQRDAVEVASPGDNNSVLLQRLMDVWNLLPSTRRGDLLVYSSNGMVIELAYPP